MTRSASPWNSPDISAMPAALSATGPNVSSETTTPVVASMPMPHRATRYSENWVNPPPRPMATAMATAMAMIAHTDDSRPDEVPESTVVAGPVSAASAMSRTGVVSVDVKYSVMRLATWARTRPTTTAPNMRRPTLPSLPSGSRPTYFHATIRVPMTVRMPAVRKPRLIGAMADFSPSRAFTMNTPTIEASTPMARAASGNRAPAAHRPGFSGKICWKAGTPRMIDATRVTS
jgi:hypothetical protein